MAQFPHHIYNDHVGAIIMSKQDTPGSQSSSRAAHTAGTHHFGKSDYSMYLSGAFAIALPGMERTFFPKTLQKPSTQEIAISE